MYQFVLVLHVLICLALIGMVLIHHGKGADIGAAFGSGASNTVFGSRGTGSFLFRLTGGLALAFFVTSLLLSYLISVKSQPGFIQGTESSKPKTNSLPLPTESEGE